MTQTIHHRLHILEAADWKDGVITLLEPRSPYRPWRYAFGEARAGDYAMLVLRTDPVSVLTVLARVGEEDDLGGAMLDLPRYRADIVDLSTLAMMLGLNDNAFTTWRLDDDDAEAVILALHERRLHGDPYDRCGHSSLIAARNLLRFSGGCHGCGTEIDLSKVDTREQVHVHTVDPSPRPEPDSPIRTDEGASDRLGVPWLRSEATDWPAVICRRCRDRMRDGGYTSFVDFRFAQHPQCPHCGGRRASAIQYGMPADPQSWGPWLTIGGCCVRGEEWRCGLCGHEW
ncbi:hypothetical protein [Mycolicibacterium baixiangningiae]|uniref:hypothetical protein n=1 Tax=Mycolicibacterium baixiangningiae TaxID=2761578 RepID=UPI001E4DC6FD|nr:hypothetical protein [Mycolicibacterium baixiangningiae]